MQQDGQSHLGVDARGEVVVVAWLGVAAVHLCTGVVWPCMVEVEIWGLALKS